MQGLQGRGPRLVRPLWFLRLEGHQPEFRSQLWEKEVTDHPRTPWGLVPSPDPSNVDAIKTKLLVRRASDRAPTRQFVNIMTVGSAGLQGW